MGVAKREWGAKHSCTSCGVKFYDLHRNPIACPKCGTEVAVEAARPNRRRPAAPPEPARPAKEEAVVVAPVVAATEGDADGMIDNIHDNHDDHDDHDGLVEGVDDGKPRQPES